MFSIMYHILIGSTEPEPDKKFIQLAHDIIGDQLPCVDFDVAPLQAKDNTRFFSNLKSSILANEFSQPHQTFNASDSRNLPSNETVLNPAHPDLVIFNINQISKKNRSLIPFLKALRNSSCAILLLNPKSQDLSNIILKYDGSNTSMVAIHSFSHLFHLKAKNAENSTLISPLSLKKYQVTLEKRFVKRISSLYGALGFIKLPLNSATDFLNYSLKNKADLLIFSKSDIKEITAIIDFQQFVKENTLSIFIG